MLLKVIFIFVLLIIFKVIFNLYYLFIAKYYYSKYLLYLNKNDNWYISNHGQSIVNIFNKAGIQDSKKPYTEPVGYGQVVNSSFLIFKNIANRREDVVQYIINSFNEAISIFQQRIIHAFNPFFWLEFFLFLPKYVLSYLGVTTDNIAIKILNLLWWFFNLIISISVIFFKGKLIEILNHIF